MRKIWNVIINEYIKIFAKISTKIMLICIVLLAVLWNVGMYFSSRNNSYSPESYELDFDARISEYSGVDETRADMYRFMKEIGIESLEDWRYNAINDITYELEDKQAPSGQEEKSTVSEWYKKAIRNNDYKEYIKLRMKYISGNNALTSEERGLKLGSLQYLLDHDIPPSYSDYRYQKLRNLETNKIDLARQEQMPLDSQDKKTITKLRNDIAIDEYTLERNIETYMVPDDGDNYFDMNGFLPVFSNSTMLIMVINVLIIIVAGSIISTEFSSGTIKFLLINPIKRWKILVAKYLAVLTVGIIMLVIYYVFNLLLAGIFFGFGDMGAPLLSVVNGKVHAGSSLLYVAWKYILGSLGVLTMATFAFAVSSLVRNSALAIGLGTFLLLSGYGAVFILASGLHWDWARYILFANTDINMIINNQTPFLGHTVGFALIVTAVYMVVFLLTAWDAFVRRDVK